MSDEGLSGESRQCRCLHRGQGTTGALHPTPGLEHGTSVPVARQRPRPAALRPDAPVRYVEDYTVAVYPPGTHLYENDGGIPVEQAQQNIKDTIDVVFAPIIADRALFRVDNCGELCISARPWQIAEFEVYEQGYVPEGQFVSRVFELDARSTLGEIRWGGHKDREAVLRMRTRSGGDEDPNWYWRYTGRGDELTYLDDNGQPRSAAPSAHILSSPVTRAAGTPESPAMPASMASSPMGLPLAVTLKYCSEDMVCSSTPFMVPAMAWYPTAKKWSADSSRYGNRAPRFEPYTTFASGCTRSCSTLNIPCRSATTISVAPPARAALDGRVHVAGEKSAGLGVELALHPGLFPGNDPGDPLHVRTDMHLHVPISFLRFHLRRSIAVNANSDHRRIPLPRQASRRADANGFWGRPKTAMTR